MIYFDFLFQVEDSLDSSYDNSNQQYITNGKPSLNFGSNERQYFGAFGNDPTFVAEAFNNGKFLPSDNGDPSGCIDEGRISI